LEFRPRTNLANQGFNLGSETFPFTRLYVKELIGPDGNNILVPDDGGGDRGDGEPHEIEIPELTSFEFSDNDSTATGDANGFTYSGQQKTIKLGELGGNAGLRVEGGSSFSQVTTSGIGLQGASGISMHSGGTGVDIRSEERRVGKEDRAMRWVARENKIRFTERMMSATDS